MTRKSSFAVLFLLFLFAAASASAQTLTKVTVTPTSASAPKGKTYQFQAYGWFSNGTRQLLTSKAQWTSSNTAIATVESSAGSGGVLIGTGGKVSTVAQGLVTITATYTQPGGATHSGSASFTVSAPAVTGLVVTLTPSAVAISGVSNITAQASYSDGTTADVTAQATYSSSSSTIAAVSNVTDTATGKAAGNATITGTIGTVRGSQTLVVAGAGSKIINVTNAGGGSVSSSPAGVLCGTTCSKAFASTVTTVTLSAATATGNQFAGWTGACAAAGTATTCKLGTGGVAPLNAVNNVTATFRGKVNVLRYGGGGGTVTSNLGGITCGTDCSEFYDIGSTAQLTAVENFAGTGGSFDSWSGCDSVSGNVCTVKVTGTRQPQATFDMDLDITVEGDNGTVVSNIAGINCDAEQSVVDGCSEEYHYNTAVNLTITPPSGSHVSATGCDILTSIAGGKSVCTVTMNAPRAVNVRFVYFLDVTLTNNGGGTLSDTATTNPSGDDGQITCNPDDGFNDCHGEYLSGTVVELMATPNAGGLFAEWTSGDCLPTPTDNPCLITMDGDKTTNGRFTFTLEAVIGHGFGSVLSTPSGVSCDDTSDPCEAEFTYKTTVDVAASAALGSDFVDWTGCSSQPITGTCRVSTTSDQSITVRFNAPPVATDQTISVDEDSSDNLITLTYSDPDGDSVTFNVPVLTTAEDGSVDEGTPDNDADVTYTPLAGFFSPPDDSFDFTVSDGFASDTGTVTITVNEGASGLDVTAPVTFDAYEGVQAFLVVQISGGDGSHTLDVVSNEPAGTVVFNVLGNWIVRWTPNLNDTSFVMGLEASDGTITTPFDVNIDVHELVSVEVAPGTAFAELSKTRQFFAIGVYDDAATHDVSDLASWGVTDGSVASIGFTTGLATGDAEGITNVEGTVDGITGSGSLEVVDFDTRYAFTANDDGTISQWAVDSATGQLRPNGFIVASVFDRLVINPAGNKLYAFNTAVEGVYIYDIAEDGTLSETSFSPFNNYGTGTFRQSLVLPATSEKRAYSSVTGISKSSDAYSVNGLGQLSLQFGGGFVNPVGEFVINSAETRGFVVEPTFPRVVTYNTASGALSSMTQTNIGLNAKRLVVDALDRFLFIIYDDGAGTWAVKSWVIGGGGGLTLQSTYVPSNTPQYLVSGLNGNQLYLATDTEIEVIDVDGSGNLTSGGTVTTECAPQTIAMDVLGTYVYIGCTSAEIQRFARDTGTGALTSIPKVAARGGVQAIAFTKGAALEFVPEFAYTIGGSTSGIRGYSINASTGALTAVAGSPYNEGTSSHDEINTTPDGKFLYTDRAAGADLHGYSINQSTGELTNLGTFSAGSVAEIGFHPNSSYLYAAQSTASAGVRVYSIAANGTLTSQQTVSTSGGTGNAGGLVVDALGRFVYVTGNNLIDVYSISPTTGQLTSVYTTPTLLNTPYLGVHPSGRFLYASQNAVNPRTLDVYTVGDDGTLTGPTSLSVSVGTDRPMVDPSGKYLYTSNQSGATASSALTIDQSTGALTANGSGAGTNFVNDLRVDISGKYLYLVESTSPTTVRIFPINSDGTLGTASTVTETGDNFGRGITTTGKIQ